MKTRTLLSIMTLILAVLIIAGSCTTTSNPDKMVFERFCGTWANKDYEPEPGELMPNAKTIMNPDGTCVWYQFLNQTCPTKVGTYTADEI